MERYSWFTLSTETSPTGLYDGGRPNLSGTTYRAVGRCGVLADDQAVATESADLVQTRRATSATALDSSCA